MTSARQRASLADQVFDRLEQQILRGDYAPGEVLSENGLSAQLGVSRTPVREALARLESEGLLHTVKGRGIVVSGVTPKDAADIFEIRLRIEGLAAARCARYITEKQRLELEEILELQEFYAGKDNAERMRVLDSDFHRAIFEYCASPCLTAILIDLHHKVQQYRKLSISTAGRTQKAVMEHKQIYDAIAAHDPERAEALMADHIQNAYANIQSYYQKEHVSWE
jgi:DNA-binding GntR family transcriptional regulator